MEIIDAVLVIVRLDGVAQVVVVVIVVRRVRPMVMRMGMLMAVRVLVNVGVLVSMDDTVGMAMRMNMGVGVSVRVLVLMGVAAVHGKMPFARGQGESWRLRNALASHLRMPPEWVGQVKKYPSFDSGQCLEQF